MLPSASRAFADAPVPMAVVGIRHKLLTEVLLVNAALADLLNSAPEQIVGMQLADLVHPDDTVLLDSPVDMLASPLEQLQLRVVRNGWGVIWTMLSVNPQLDGRSEPDCAVIVLQDVTMWRRIEEELAHRAAHDSLTGLANRSLLFDHIDRALARLGRRTGTVAVLFCDLDGFKTLNDTFGHRVGDAVLQEVAGRILNAMRREDVVVRMGGDEFVVVCEAIDTSEAGRVAERVRQFIEPPMRIHERDFTITVSVGVAQVSENSTDPEDLVRRADLAMYRAKQRGRNRVEFFAPELEDQARSRVEIVERVRTALLEGNVMIEVQPIVDLPSGAWSGSEAFARIRQPGSPPLLPAQFLQSIAQEGLLERLDTKVREQAMGWLASRVSGGSSVPGWVSVNVSVRALAAMRFAGTIEEELEEFGLRPDQLVIELSESALTELRGPTQVTLRRLRAAGCLVAIDDFGSGQSSLTSLRDLPADFLKIDRSFVAGLGHDDHDEAIVSAIISVGHRIGRRIIAEGIENRVQAEMLLEMGCDFGQGYLFGPPNPPAGH